MCAPESAVEASTGAEARSDCRRSRSNEWSRPHSRNLVRMPSNLPRFFILTGDSCFSRGIQGTREARRHRQPSSPSRPAARRRNREFHRNLERVRALSGALDKCPARHRPRRTNRYGANRSPQTSLYLPEVKRFPRELSTDVDRGESDSDSDERSSGWAQRRNCDSTLGSDCTGNNGAQYSNDCKPSTKATDGKSPRRLQAGSGY